MPYAYLMVILIAVDGLQSISISSVFDFDCLHFDYLLFIGRLLVVYIRLDWLIWSLAADGLAEDGFDKGGEVISEKPSIYRSAPLLSMHTNALLLSLGFLRYFSPIVLTISFLCLRIFLNTLSSLTSFYTWGNSGNLAKLRTEDLMTYFEPLRLPNSSIVSRRSCTCCLSLCCLRLLHWALFSTV